MSDILGVPALADDPEINGLTADSRAVGPNFLFAALPGSRSDGRDHVEAAIKAGAVAVLAPPGFTRPGIVVIQDPLPRRAFALAAARFFGRQPATIAAVTGTNGKTSVVTFTRQIWTRLGLRAASLGTLGVVGPAGWARGGLTTPDPVALHKGLAELAAAGIDHAAIEASSHGLDQFRLDGVRLRAAAFTNLTRDHLDYHADMEAYLAAKLRLFGDLLPEGAGAVVNSDAPDAGRVLGFCHARRLKALTFGEAPEADLRIVEAIPAGGGQDLSLVLMGRPVSLHLPLAGAFQASNALCALGLVLACGGDPIAAAAALETLEGVPGRLEKVAERSNGAPVFVDYAHTPDALETVLKALRPHAARRLAVVFGCGGDRDPGKRPPMGRIAAELADRVIVTDDNPRGEEPASIRRQILDACPGAREIGDRGRAIALAVAELEAGDVLVLAGKGHETGQTAKGVTTPFDDAQVARDAVKAVES
ncbi:MAG: UDP-N-acetylmuramoyl-L-alanyl-D-glutamate--2,6-diaminopimelate ligase [Alphaproteobacteria bacterium]|nr:UDP-N-acetylmuramoyl-L-alanyl-D-glutamate--2,6-diaminopimelate ligase [Alphaproteobacteria bacterium]